MISATAATGAATYPKDDRHLEWALLFNFVVTKQAFLLGVTSRF